MRTMILKRPAHPPADPDRDPRLAQLLRREFGSTESENADRAQRVIGAVAQQSKDIRAGWRVITSWSRTVVRIGSAIAAATLFMLFRAPSDLVRNPPMAVSDAGTDRGDAVVAIITTRSTIDQVVATFVPTTPDDLLTAAVRR
jgi:hypothetical protein